MVAVQRKFVVQLHNFKDRQNQTCSQCQGRKSAASRAACLRSVLAGALHLAVGADLCWAEPLLWAPLTPT
ncbi:hypothetical protein PO909_018672 [Leuciscus waleckii]